MQKHYFKKKLLPLAIAAYCLSPTLHTYASNNTPEENDPAVWTISPPAQEQTLLSSRSSLNSSFSLSTKKTITTAYPLYYSDVSPGDNAIIHTTADSGTTPLQGWGVYMASGGATNYRLGDVNITTEGYKSDAIHTNSQGCTFTADSLTIKVTGDNADGINLGSNFDQTGDNLVNIQNSANIRVKQGVAVRANNYQNESGRSIISLPNNSRILVGYKVVDDNVNDDELDDGRGIDTDTATNHNEALGYAVYAGNRNRDTNNLPSWWPGTNNTLGSSFVFIGDNSTIKTSLITSGHAVYANKGGFIQLGNNVNITTTGTNAMAIYASTEQQGTHNNIRPGTVFLAGGATLRAKKSENVIEASGAGSKIVSKKIDIPDFNQNGINIADLETAPASWGVFDIEGNLSAVSEGTIDLNLADQSIFNGSTSVDDVSKLNLNITGPNSEWRMTKDSIMSNLTLSDNAAIYFSKPDDPDNYNTLTINGDYHGDNGRFIFTALLGDDHSMTDTVVIKGDADGTTKIIVNNLGGSGAKTINGIRIVRVMGTSTPNAFVQENRIVAGAYEYFLKKGTQKRNAAESWYLTNTLVNTDPPDKPDPPPGPTKPVKPTPIVRPEGGAYLGNAYAANNIFQHTLHDRIGELSLLAPIYKNNTWGRIEKKRVSTEEASRQIGLKQNYNVFQTGIDLISKNTDTRLYRLGIMGGYGQAKTTASGLLYDAKSSIQGYSIGLYGTIYDEPIDKNSRYLDAWILWNNFDGTVSGQGLPTEKYNLNGITASLEAGYDQLLLKSKTNSNHNLWLKWQAQITYQGVRADKHLEYNGTKIGKNGSNIQTRLGLRFYKKVIESTNKSYQPYAELNWYHNTSTYNISMDNDKDFSTYGLRNVFELKLGYETKIGKNLQLSGNISGGIGSHGTRTYSAKLGFEYTF